MSREDWWITEAEEPDRFVACEFADSYEPGPYISSYRYPGKPVGWEPSVEYGFGGCWANQP